MLYNISVGAKYFYFVDECVLYTLLGHTDGDTHRLFFWKGKHNKFIGIECLHTET